MFAIEMLEHGGDIQRHICLSELCVSLLVVCYPEGCDELSWKFYLRDEGIAPGSPSPTSARAQTPVG